MSPAINSPLNPIKFLKCPLKNLSKTTIFAVGYFSCMYLVRFEPIKPAPPVISTFLLSICSPFQLLMKFNEYYFEIKDLN